MLWPHLLGPDAKTRRGSGDAELVVHLSGLEHAHFLLRTVQCESTFEATTAAILTEALAEGREPLPGPEPPAARIPLLLPSDLVEDLRLEAHRRGTAVEALVGGLLRTAMPD